MFNFIVRKLKENLPRFIYNLIKLPYSLIFINPKYSFSPIGFFQKTKLDIYELFGKEDFKINFGNFKFFYPGWKMLLEKNGYYKLNNLKNVLDLGGYIGDSSIELCMYNNEKIYVFEPEKEKFKWLMKNVNLNKLNKKIIAYNFAVILRNKKEMAIKKNGNFCGASSFTSDYSLKETEIVKCMNIANVIKIAEFDGFKCDIEGGEFEIIKYFLKNPDKFNFKKGIIEWHFFGEKFEKKIILKFLKFLKKNKYSFYFYPQNKPENHLDTRKEIKKIFDKTEISPHTNMFYFVKLS